MVVFSIYFSSYPPGTTSLTDQKARLTKVDFITVNWYSQESFHSNRQVYTWRRLTVVSKWTLVYVCQYPIFIPTPGTPHGACRRFLRDCLASWWDSIIQSIAWMIIIDFFILQIEKSPTLGSIETPDYEKRLLASQSLEYNLKDSVFCELFPETVSVSRWICSTSFCDLWAFSEYRISVKGDQSGVGASQGIGKTV